MKIFKTANYKKVAQIINPEGVVSQMTEQYARQLAEMGNSLGTSVVKGEISREEAIQKLEQYSKSLAEKIINEKIESLSATGQEIRQDIDSFKQKHPGPQTI